MFGFSVHTAVTPDRLVVNSPFSFTLLLVLSGFVVWPLIIIINKRPLPVTKLIVFFIIFIIAFDLLPSQSRLTLDRPSNTLKLRRYMFFHWSTETIPLTDLDIASVRTRTTTSQIQLQFVGGDTRIMSELNQAGGKDQAVYDINQFIGKGR